MADLPVRRGSNGVQPQNGATAVGSTSGNGNLPKTPERGLGQHTGRRGLNGEILGGEVGSANSRTGGPESDIIDADFVDLGKPRVEAKSDFKAAKEEKIVDTKRQKELGSVGKYIKGILFLLSAKVAGGLILAAVIFSISEIMTKENMRPTIPPEELNAETLKNVFNKTPSSTTDRARQVEFDAYVAERQARDPSFKAPGQ